MVTSADVLKIAAFSDGKCGGNPAGVAIGDHLPSPEVMQAIAADIGFSETAFAAPGDQEHAWVVRYYSPEIEVPFCGHATIALGAALVLRYGDGVFQLNLSQADITVEGVHDGDVISAALQSPPTSSQKADDVLVTTALGLFGYGADDIDARIPPAIADAGGRILILALNDRVRLSQMAYDLEVGREVMKAAGVETISLIYAESNQLFHTRNPFAAGGVYEDPATGAAAAALAGYLRDINWPHGGCIDIVQGEDMGMKSLLRAEILDVAGSSVRVSGAARVM